MRHCIRRCSMFMSVLLCLCACDGGLMGTSTGPGQGQDSGPKIVKGEVPRLPKKISPRLPDSITGSAQSPTQNNPVATVQAGSVERQTRAVMSTAQNDEQQAASRSWALLQPSMQQVESTRIAVQEVLALLDREFESILADCHFSLVQTGQCVLDAGEIEAWYDDVVTRQMVAVHQTANAATPAAEIVEDAEAGRIREIYRELEGSAIVFNQFSIKVPTDSTQSFSLTTSTDALLQGRELRLSWNVAYDQITYDLIDSSLNGYAELYNYRNNVSGQQLTVQRTVTDTGIPQSFSIELTAQAEDTGDVYYNARVDDIYLTGQAANDRAYAYSRDTDADDGDYYQEIFDEFGYLIALQECFHDRGYPCDEDEIEEVFLEFYLSEEEYDEVIDGFGFDDVMVINLPSDVVEFLVLENDPDIPLLLRDEFCDGWQPYPGEVEIFCFAPDFELDDAVVVSVDDGNLTLIPGARVIIED